MRYYIETGRWNKDWKREAVEWDNPEDFYDLDAYIQLARASELYEGKYGVRVVDENGTVMSHIVDPYTPPRIDLKQIGVHTISSIRAAYGIDKADMAVACRQWLEDYDKTKDK
mgnify:CR=1 FL=1